MASVSSVERFLQSKKANRKKKEKISENLCNLWEINNKIFSQWLKDHRFRVFCTFRVR